MEPLTDGRDGFVNFVAHHKVQLEANGIPPLFWETLYLKLQKGIFDAGEKFTLAKIEGGEEHLHFSSWKVLVCCAEGIKATDPQNIYLVDHAWTFRPDQARAHLLNVDGLLERMCGLTGVPFSNQERAFSAKEVMKEIWKYTQAYSIGNPDLEAEDRLPIWYVMDEFGSRIQHSDEPSFRLVPLFYMTEQATYSILFPVSDLDMDDEVTRDFVEGPNFDIISRSALLCPWSNDFVIRYLDNVSLEQSEPSADYFKASRTNESLPNAHAIIPALPQDRPIRAYVEYVFIRDFLKHPRFQLVEDADEADILWLSSHFKNYKLLSEKSPHQRVNQFPGEHLLTVKDLLCIVARRAKNGSGVDGETLETSPNWLPTTFNLKTELPQFVAFYTEQKTRGLPNYWIVKPWNLARSLDTHITDNLDFILRLAVSGPKIAQRYIDRPVLFFRPELNARVKFDVRYIILLSSVKPLKAYAYRRFWLRFANKPFELDNFDEYERHFTVMNYSANNLHQMFCHDFVRLFEEQNPDHKWADVEERIFNMLGELLRAAAKGGPSASLMECPQSRAMYAVDLMLMWSRAAPGEGDSLPSIQPKLLEINWAPDCKRACVYYPEFFDDVFSVLFLDEIEGRNVKPL